MSRTRSAPVTKPALSVSIMQATARAHEFVCDGDYVAAHSGYAYTSRLAWADWWRGLYVGWRASRVVDQPFASVPPHEHAGVAERADGFLPVYQQWIDGRIARTPIGTLRETRDAAEQAARERAHLIEWGFSVHRFGDVFPANGDGTPDLDADKWFVAVAIDSPFASADFDTPDAESEEAAWENAWAALTKFQQGK